MWDGDLELIEVKSVTGKALRKAQLECADEMRETEKVVRKMNGESKRLRSL